jgi:hypothetical protein
MKTPMLIQASNMYTACIFEAFQAEYERSLAAYARPMETPNEYIVGVVRVVDGRTIMEKEYKVESDPSNKMVFCSCQQLERIGILCSHALKVLDMMNIKVLLEHYILKRWTREARCGVVQDIHGNNVIENPKIDAVDTTKIFPASFFQSLLGQLTMEKSIHMSIMCLILYNEMSMKRLKTLQIFQLISLWNKKQLQYLKSTLTSLV